MRKYGAAGRCIGHRSVNAPMQLCLTLRGGFGRPKAAEGTQHSDAAWAWALEWIAAGVMKPTHL
jgi:hypothetical protein